MASPGFRVDPQNPASPQATESFGSGLQINIRCHTVTIERPPTPSENPPHQRAAVAPDGVWDPSGGIPDFVKTLYWNVLDRMPESQSVIDHWTRKTHEHGLAHTVGGFFTSEEYKGKGMLSETTAKKFYLAVMGRQAEPDERAHWTKRINNGMSLTQVANFFVADSEYRRMVKDGKAPDPIHWPS